MNRKREKEFINKLREDDFEAFLDLKKNIKEYLENKIIGQNGEADDIQQQE
jgi:hypothetical protein